MIRIAEILEVDPADFLIDLKPQNDMSETRLLYGFATKGDVEELVRMIHEVMKEVNQLKDSMIKPKLIPAKKEKKK